MARRYQRRVRPESGPGRAGLVPPYQVSVRIEFIDKSISRAGDVIVFGCVLKGVSYK